MTGPKTIFEGDFGIFKAYSDNPRMEQLVADLGERFDILDTSIKPYPFCDGNFAPMEAVLQIVGEQKLTIDDIEHMHFRMLPSLIPYVMTFQGDSSRKVRPETDLDAQMSLPYCIAAGLLKNGDVWLDDFHPDRYREEARLAIADKVTAEADASLADGPRRPITMPVVATVDTTDGRTFTRRIDYQMGDPRNPLPAEGFKAKLTRCVEPALGADAAADILSAFDRLEHLDDVGTLTAKLCRQ